MPFIEFNQIETQVGNSNPLQGLYTLLGVVIGFGLTRLYQFLNKRKSISDTGRLYNFYIESVKGDFEAQIKDIERYSKEVKKNKQSISILDGVFIFDFFEKINILLLIEYFKKNKVLNYIEKANNLFDSFNFGKNEIKKLPNIVSEYEVAYIAFEEEFYDYLIQFEKDVKFYEDSWLDDETNELDNANLNSLNELIDKHVDDCDYDLAAYIRFDKTFMKELLKHPYYSDSKHKLYNVVINFIDNWHKLTMRATSKRDLHLLRIEVINRNLRVIYNDLFVDSSNNQSDKNI